jgi:hypothetical protein
MIYARRKAIENPAVIRLRSEMANGATDQAQFCRVAEKWQKAILRPWVSPARQSKSLNLLGN